MHSGAPGRPIILGVESLTHKASKLINDYLRPSVESLPSYLKDTIHLLTILDNVHVTEETQLASIDVEVLYSYHRRRAFRLFHHF